MNISIELNVFSFRDIFNSIHLNNKYFIDLKSALSRSETFVESMTKSNKVITTENNRDFDIESVKSVKIKNFEELKVYKSPSQETIISNK